MQDQYNPSAKLISATATNEARVYDLTEYAAGRLRDTVLRVFKTHGSYHRRGDRVSFDLQRGRMSLDSIIAPPDHCPKVRRRRLAVLDLAKEGAGGIQITLDERMVYSVRWQTNGVLKVEKFVRGKWERRIRALDPARIGGGRGHV